jgi:hypothetical protein
MPALVSWVEVTTAEREAQQNYRRNHSALVKNQPEAAALLDRVELDLEWVYARDGSLSARHTDGRWWGDCSVPVLAGAAVLKSLDPQQTGSCLLAPSHAGLVRAARERCGLSPALFVVQPDAEIARVILSTHDFSDQIAAHRFWMLTGPEWADHLRTLLEKFPGLAVPTRFIRTQLTTDDEIAPLIKIAQDVFSPVLADRTRHLSKLQDEPVPKVNPNQILLICGSQFRLWDDAPRVLREQLSAGVETDFTLHDFDTDNALCGSPLALVQAARECGSVVSANLCRADCNHLISTQVPWITWVTVAAVPAFEAAGPRDALVLADPNWRAIARKAGWPENRIRICGWPARPARTDSSSGELDLICDTLPIEIPPQVKDFSSHRLLWELIAEELAADPLAVEKIEAYLTDRARQLSIEIDALDRRSFVDRLIIPAYQQGLARVLITSGLPIAIWGHGWKVLPEFAEKSRGTVTNSEQLEQAIAGSAGLIYSWPQRSVHPMDAMGKLIVQRSGRDQAQLINNARRVLSGAGIVSRSGNAPLDRVILDLIETA